MKYGFVNVATAIPGVLVGDTEHNVKQIESLIAQAEGRGIEIICFPELCITGYSCQDLFGNQLLLDKAEEALLTLLDFTRMLDIVAIVGLPVSSDGMLLNCAVVMQHGKVLGIVPKTYLPSYKEFYEKRWFASAQDLNNTQIYLAGSPVNISSEPIVFVTMSGIKFGVEICEDLWAPVPPSCNLCLAGADIIFNLSASNELIGKHTYLLSLLSQQSARLLCGYVYSGCGFGESTQDVVYSGNAFIYENGKQLCASERFSLTPQLCVGQIDVESLRTDRRANTTFINSCRNANARIVNVEAISEHDFRLERKINPHPFIPAESDKKDSFEDILNIQASGLIKRLLHINTQKAVLGISGGLDSTLALLVTVRAFDLLKIDRKGINGVTMPGLGTTNRTHNNAVSLMKLLEVTSREINITKSVEQHFEDIGHNRYVFDSVYENSQARERTQILMDLANQMDAIVIGTGDLSELVLGWTTYNGDHMSMYGVNVGIPKTLIRHLINYIAEEKFSEEIRAILLDIADTPISPELTPADEQGLISQKTEDIIGPYELHDFFLYYFLRYGFSPEKIFMLAKHAFNGSQVDAGRYDEETIKKWLLVFCQRFFSQQFKRSCLPDGPKVGSVSLSPRGDWRMPSDASATIWLKSLMR